MLQERIETLGSGILNFNSETVYILGFNNIKRLEDYYINKKLCFCSQGIYPNKELDWGKINDNALFILTKDNEEFKRYQFEVLLKDTIKYKDSDTKQKSRVYKIRKCKYNNLYNFIIRKIVIEDSKEVVLQESYLFESKKSLQNFFFERFSKMLII